MRRVAVSDDEMMLHTVRVMAERTGVSERTVYRLLRRPEAACFELVPVGNAGGGAAAVRGGMANSFDALLDLHRASVRSVRAEAARQRGRGSSGGSAAQPLIQCSSGAVWYK
jgi:hypothetical protein